LLLESETVDMTLLFIQCLWLSSTDYCRRVSWIGSLL